MKNQKPIDSQIQSAEQELAALDAKRKELQARIEQLKEQKRSIADEQLPFNRLSDSNVTNNSNQEQKIALFRSLFRGREDVYPGRFESKRTGKSGYTPVCRNEWIRPICQKPKIKCGNCENRDFIPLSDDAIRNHLYGIDPTDRYQNEFVIGVYPMLLDETCWFLAVDLDKEAWKENSKAYLETCETFNVPAALERSRSENGGHIWIFFSEPIPAKFARQLGAFMLTKTMESRPEMGFNSYDRFFPSQDTLPKGGFGNLIALPLQAKPIQKGNSLFVDEYFSPYPDQWRFLSAVGRMSFPEVQSVVDKAAYRGGVLGVRFISTDEDDISPWLYSPSGKKPEIKIVDPLPDSVDIILANQIYVAKKKLPSVLKNKLIRLAAFQNPEFYKAQAMRYPTYGKPRVVHCCEDFPNYIGLPIGCLEDTIGLLHSLGIQTRIIDDRFGGERVNIEFMGTLRSEQLVAAEALLEHDTGVLSASTAFGKTVVAAYLIAKRSVNTLILVHFIFMNCGPVRYKVDDKKQAAARPFAHKVIFRETKFRMPASFEADRYTSIHEIYEIEDD